MNNKEYTKKQHSDYIKARTENVMKFYPELEKEKKDVVLDLFTKVEKTPGSFLLHPNFVWHGDRDPAHASFVLTFKTGAYLKKEIKFRLHNSQKKESVVLQWKPDRKHISLKNKIEDGKLKLSLQKPTIDFNTGVKEELTIDVNFKNNLSFRFKNEKFVEKGIPKKLTDIYQDLTLTLHIPIKNNLKKDVKNSLKNFDIRDVDVDLNPYIGGVIYATITSNKLKGNRPLGFIAFSNLWLNTLIRVKKHWIDENGRVKKLNLDAILTLILPFSSFELFFSQKTSLEHHKPMIFINNVNRLISKLNKGS